MSAMPQLRADIGAPPISWDDGYSQARRKSNVVADQPLNRRHRNEGAVRFTCFVLTLETPFVHPIVSIVNVAYRILKLATLFHFWTKKESEYKYNFKTRLADAGKDLLRIVATPLSILGLELAAIYGILRPYEGRELYKRIERAIYGKFSLDTCHRPGPQVGLSMRDFHPISRWNQDLNGEKWKDTLEYKFIVDQTAHRRYWNDPKGLIRKKCLLLTLGTPFVHPITSIVNVAYRILKLATLSHFLTEKEGEGKYNFKTRLADAGKDLLRIVATPLSILGLELAAIYGIFQPYDGRKLYASIERATYSKYTLAPCCQPQTS